MSLACLGGTGEFEEALSSAPSPPSLEKFCKEASEASGASELSKTSAFCGFFSDAARQRQASEERPACVPGVGSDASSVASDTPGPAQASEKKPCFCGVFAGSDASDASDARLQTFSSRRLMVRLR